MKINRRLGWVFFVRNVSKSIMVIHTNTFTKLDNVSDLFTWASLCCRQMALSSNNQSSNTSFKENLLQTMKTITIK